jgi:hypothetical protein
MSRQPEERQNRVGRRPSPFQISLGGLIIIVVCCAAVLWSYRKVREHENPSIAQARTLKSGNRHERLEAARFFLVHDPDDPEFAEAILIDALNDQDAMVRSEAVRALGVVAKRLLAVPSRRKAPPAVEALINVLLDRHPPVPAPDRSNLSRTVGNAAAASSGKREEAHSSRIVTDESEIQDLAQVLNDPSWMAARALGEAAPNTDCADTAVAALTEALRTELDERRLKVITRSLGRFGSAASEVIPDLTQALRKAVAARGAADEWLWIIADTLVRIAPATTEADEAVAALMDCLRSRDDQERQALAVRALIKLGPAAHSAVPALIDTMRDGQTRTEAYVGRQYVPEALGRIAPGTRSAAAAVLALTEALDADESDLRLGALQALSRFGPAAKSAIPRLEALKKANVFPNLTDQVLRAVDPGR